MTTVSIPAWTSSDMAAAFAFAHALIKKPSPDQHAWLLSPGCRNIWNEVVASIGRPTLPLDVPSDYDDYCERYIATFDVGTPTPPVPLIESHYNNREPIPRILHENILFYRQFGLHLRDSALESADHLRHQIEFVQHLLEYHSQLEATRQAGSLEQVNQALIDYSRRHLASWLPAAIICAEEAPLQFAHSALILADSLAGLIAEPAENCSSDINADYEKEAQQCLD